MNANLIRKLKYPEAHIKMSHDKIMIYSGIYDICEWNIQFCTLYILGFIFKL